MRTQPESLPYIGVFVLCATLTNAAAAKGGCCCNCQTSIGDRRPRSAARGESPQSVRSSSPKDQGVAVNIGLARWDLTRVLLQGLRRQGAALSNATVRHTVKHPNAGPRDSSTNRRRETAALQACWRRHFFPGSASPSALLSRQLSNVPCLLSRRRSCPPSGHA